MDFHAKHEADEEFADAAVLYGRVLTLDPDDLDATIALDRCRSESNLRAERTTKIRDLFVTALDAFTAGDLVTAATIATASPFGGASGFDELAKQAQSSHRLLLAGGGVYVQGEAACAGGHDLEEDGGAAHLGLQGGNGVGGQFLLAELALGAAEVFATGGVPVEELDLESGEAAAACRIDVEAKAAVASARLRPNGMARGHRRRHGMRSRRPARAHRSSKAMAARTARAR